MENNNSSDRIDSAFIRINFDDIPYFQTSPYKGYSIVQAFLHILTNVVRETTVLDSDVTLYPGQMLFNATKVSSVFGWSRPTVYKFLDRLESMQLIRYSKNDKNCIVTLLMKNEQDFYSVCQHEDAKEANIILDENNVSGHELLVEESSSDVDESRDSLINNISSLPSDWMDGHILDDELCAKLDMLDNNNTSFGQLSEDVIKTVMSEFITTAYRKWGVPKHTIPEDAMNQILQVSLSLFRNDCRNEILIWLRSLRRFSLATTYRCLEGDDAPLIAANHEILRSAFHYFGLKFLQDFRKPCKFLDCDFG